MKQHGGFLNSSMLFYVIALAIAVAVGLMVFSTVKERFANTPSATVTFYLKTGCTWCEKLKPALEKLKTMNPPAKIVEVRDDSAAASAAGVKGFPTIILTGGKSASPLEYSGERTAEAMNSWIAANV